MLIDLWGWHRDARRRMRRAFKEYILARRRGEELEAAEWLLIAELWWGVFRELDYYVWLYSANALAEELMDLGDAPDPLEGYRFPEEFEAALEARLRAMLREIVLHEDALDPENSRKRFELYRAAYVWAEAVHWWKRAAAFWQTGPRDQAEDAERRAREAEARAEAIESDAGYEYEEPLPEPEPPPPNPFSHPPGTLDLPGIPPTAV